MLINIGFEYCTAFHYPEEIVASEIYVQPPENEESYSLVGRRGEVISVKTRRHTKLERDFPKFGPELSTMPSFRSGTIHGSEWKLFSLQDLYKILFAALDKNKRATLAASSSE